VNLAALQAAIAGIDIPTATAATATEDGAPGIVKLAKSSDTASLTTAATPAGVAAQIAAKFSNSSASSGYFKLPDGMIIQAGLSGTIGDLASATVTFPIAFPSKCIAVVTSGTTNPGKTQSNDWITNVGQTSFVANNPGHQNIQYYWIAIGY
jgi:hypothetical protein